MNPEQLINNAAFRALVNRGGFMLARSTIRRTVVPLAFPRARRRELAARVDGHFARSFPAWSDQERAARVASFLEHWTNKFAEDCIAVNIDGLERFKRWVEQHVTFEGAEHLREALDWGAGVLVVGCHVGSISFCTNALLRLFLDIPREQWPVVRLCAEPEVERFPTVLEHVEAAMRDFGGDVQFILAGDGRGTVATQMLETLRLRGLVTTNLDVVHGGTSARVFELLGRRVFLPSLVGAAKIGLRTGATVLPFVNVRTDAGFTVRLERPFGPLPELGPQIADDDPELDALCQRLRGLLEGWIAAYPEQWIYWDRLQRRLAEEPDRA